MTSLFEQLRCPICGNDDCHDIFPVKDYLVSGKEFMIRECWYCTLRFTKNIPNAEQIGEYYRSADYISHTNEQKGLINRLYHLVRNRTLKAKRRLVEKYSGVKTGDLLDLGSGVGAFVHEMQEHGWKVKGLEPDEGARSVAKKNFGTELEDIPAFYRFPGSSFDAITLWHVLEHAHDLQGYMLQLKNLVRPSGKIFIAVPNYTSKDAAIYREYWAAWDVPRHLYHFSPQAMQTLLTNNGLKLKKIIPMWYDSYYVSLLSSRYKKGKTKYISAFFNGFRSNLKARVNRSFCSSLIYVAGK